MAYNAVTTLYTAHTGAATEPEIDDVCAALAAMILAVVGLIASVAATGGVVGLMARSRRSHATAAFQGCSRAVLAGSTG